MRTLNENIIAIINTPMAVNTAGKLVGNAVDNGYEYEYPVDGISDICHDEIKPYQIAPYGMVLYSKTICLHTEETVTASDNAGVNYYEFEDSEEVEEFINDLDQSVKGCLYKFAAITAIIIILLIIMCK